MPVKVTRVPLIQREDDTVVGDMVSVKNAIEIISSRLRESQHRDLVEKKENYGGTSSLNHRTKTHFQPLGRRETETMEDAYMNKRVNNPLLEEADIDKDVPVWKHVVTVSTGLMKGEDGVCYLVDVFV
ncbi:hypothetical protein Tco_0482081 [Tanacetum coccineum]